MEEFDHIPINALNLPRRTYHALARAGILTVGNLRDFYLNRYKYHIRNIGEKSFSEIFKVLDELPNNPSVIIFEKKEPVQLSFNNKLVERASQKMTCPHELGAGHQFDIVSQSLLQSR